MNTSDAIWNVSFNANGAEAFTTRWRDAATSDTDVDDADETADIRTGDIMKRLYVVIALVGLTGNALVVVTLGSFRHLRKKITNKYIINQVRTKNAEPHGREMPFAVHTFFSDLSVVENFLDKEKKVDL